MSCAIKKPNKPIRIAFGLLIITLGMLFESWLGALGLIPILFAVFGCCPACAIANAKNKKE